MNDKRFEELFNMCRERFTLRDTVNLMSLYIRGIVDEFAIEWACFTADAEEAERDGRQTRAAFDDFKTKWRARI